MPTFRPSSGYRSYSDTDVHRLHRVLLHRELGLRLALRLADIALLRVGAEPAAHGA